MLLEAVSECTISAVEAAPGAKLMIAGGGGAQRRRNCEFWAEAHAEPEPDVPNRATHRGGERERADLLIWKPRRRRRGKGNHRTAGLQRFPVAIES